MPTPRNSQRPPVSWQARVDRARLLSERFPFAREYLAFFGHLAEFQQSIVGCMPRLEGAPGTAFAEAGNPDEWVGQFPKLLWLVEEVGTPVLAAAAAELRDQGESGWRPLLASAWATGGTAIAASGETPALFARALLQPYAQAVADTCARQDESAERGSCPVCGGKPSAGALRKEALGATRQLVCSFCLSEWNFLRVMCPNCLEQDFEALPVFTAEGFEHIRINACDTCHTYLKTVDLTKDGHAIPEVDELAALPLSLWAQEQGYTKLQPNLLGL